MTSHFDTPELKVFSDPALQLIVIQSCGIIPSAIYRQGLSLATSIALKEQSLFWLVNNLEGGIITPEDQIWATEANAPQLAKESSIRKMAFIEPKDLHSKLILEDMMDNVKDVYPFEMQFFGDIPSAKAWFRDKEATVFRSMPPSSSTEKKSIDL